MIKAQIFNGLPRQSQEIRSAVFINEQGFKNEFDETDKTARHIVVFDDDSAAATCRVFFDDDKNSYVLGRLAVMKDFRGQGLGSIAVSEAEKLVRSIGGKSIMLHAQCRVSRFYEGLGYTQFGGIDLDEGCEHIWMKKEL